MDQPIIAIITDFGDQDFYTASMKGVMLQINPDARPLVVTNKVPHFDISAGAFILKASCPYFPSGTIFVVVVDPGVGTLRRTLIAESSDYYFIAPDNGVLSWIFEESGGVTVREVISEHYFLQRKGRTFEGRDKMAPVAAWLSKGISLDNFGPVISDYKKLNIVKPVREGNQVFGRIVYQDGFGNLITNISEKDYLDLAQCEDESQFIISVHEKEMAVRQSYQSVKKGELLAVLDGQGYIEIAKREGSAADETKSKPGDPVMLRLKEK
jgi:S-adenosyl-L-methionine hydrolase (adenosine-forming)